MRKIFSSFFEMNYHHQPFDGKRIIIIIIKIKKTQNEKENIIINILYT